MSEVADVLFDAGFSVTDGGARTNNKGPVGRLAQQHLSSRLIQRSFLEAGFIGIPFHEIYHAFHGFVGMSVDPVVRSVEPDFTVALVSPTR